MAASGIKLKTFPAVTVDVAGTAEPIVTSQQLVYAVIIQSIAANTGLGYLGDESVDSTNGLEVKPGGVVEIQAPDRARGTDQFDLAELFLDSSANGAVFRVSAWIRE